MVPGGDATRVLRVARTGMMVALYRTVVQGSCFVNTETVDCRRLFGFATETQRRRVSPFVIGPYTMGLSVPLRLCGAPVDPENQS